MGQTTGQTSGKIIAQIARPASISGLTHIGRSSVRFSLPGRMNWVPKRPWQKQCSPRCR